MLTAHPISLNAPILIVDDLEANVRLLQGMLRVAGYTCHPFHDRSSPRGLRPSIARTATR